MRLSEKVTSATEGASGIGRAIALALAKEGAKVIINDMPAQKDRVKEACDEIMKLGGDPLLLLADVSDVEQVNKMAEIVAKNSEGWIFW